ncbi:MAG TPA: EAL domain-containing protein [Acidimicrobiales bacterium]|nr:EAL domain-containing protein [Acidimicrobiales bacterium]
MGARGLADQTTGVRAGAAGATSSEDKLSTREGACGTMPGAGAGAPARSGLAVVDGTGRVVYIDEDLAGKLGLAPGEIVGADIFRFVAEPRRSAARQALRRSVRTGRVDAALWQLQGASGGALYALLGTTPLVGASGELLFSLSVRPRPHRYGSLQRQALLASIALECDQPIVAIGAGSLLELWNPAAEELFGWTEAEVIGAPATLMVPEDRHVEEAELLSRVWAGEVLSRVDTVRVCKHGSKVEVSISYAPLRDRWGQVTGVYELVRDITQQKASERALAFQAMHDHLTGLPNRSLLEDRMSHALERCRREGRSLGVIFFDLDHFKTVNDTAGHEVGDRLLRAVATRLRQSVRSMDTVARLGGDEFVVLCEDIEDDAQLDTIVSHVTESFTEPVMLPDRQVWVSLSGGVVRGGPSSSVAQLLSQADAAMYQAKDRQRGSVGRYDPRTRPDLERRAEGSRRLRLGLEYQELVPYFQPIVDLHTGRMVGAEALVRWEDPGRGVISAKDFISLAEEIGIVGEISEFVLAATAEHLKEWLRIAPGLRVTVNISPTQLRGPSLLSLARSLVDDGLPAGAVILELTESAIMEDTAAGTSILQELRAAGFGIAIDDFGTGYSSLAYLKQLPATVIKVDQAFTAALPDPQDLSIVMAILAIADTFGLNVVAEGIETQGQAEVLRSLGCPQGQGYLFARPLPACRFSELLLDDAKLPSLPDRAARAPGGRLEEGLVAPATC